MSLNVSPKKIESLILFDSGYVFPEQVKGMKEEKAITGLADYFNVSRYSSWNEVTQAYQDYSTRPWDSSLNAIIVSN